MEPQVLQRILSRVDAYYTKKLNRHGTTARGVDWNSEQSQRLRFEKLLEMCSGDDHISINDYGCGYGALADFMQECGFNFEYFGFDVSATMIDKARELHEEIGSMSFHETVHPMKPADYCVASGVFNVKMDVDTMDWEEYVFHGIEELAGLATRGFAFNVLTDKADADRRRPDLYYANPLRFLAHCRQRYSRSAVLLEDYGLWEFTILAPLGGDS